MALYNQYDLQKITISMLCDKAALHRSTFYLYYKNTDELLREIENNILREIQIYADDINDFELASDEAGLSPRQIFDRRAPKMIAFYEWQFSVRSYITPLLGDYGDPYFIHHYEKIIHDNILPAVKAFHLKYEKKPYIIEYLVGGVLKTNKDWLQNNNISINELVEIQRRMVLNNPFD